MKNILDNITTETSRFEAIQEYERELTEVEQEYYEVLNFCYDLIADTRYFTENPDNYAELDEITADPIAGEKPGDRVYRYCPSSNKLAQAAGIFISLKRNEKIGDWCKHRREAAGLSKYVLAKKLDCTIRSITLYEEGKQIPSFDRVVEIYQATTP